MADIQLKTEQATYEKNKDQLVAKFDGKFVVIRGQQIDGAWDTYEDALKAAYERHGLAPFLVKQVSAMEKVLFFTRDVSTCRP